MRHFLRRLRKDKRGTIITWVGISLVPMLVSVGMATDMTRGYLLRSRLATALDAAALAGGRVFNLPTRNADVQAYFDANFPANLMDAALQPLIITPIQIPGEPERLRVAVSATIPTVFMKLVGINEMTVATESEVTRENLGLQLVMVLDHTGSMAGSRINALKTASLDLVDILFGNNTVNDKISISIIPFSAAVNVGSSIGSGFIDFTGYPDDYTLDPGDDNKWKGCVLARDTITTITMTSNPDVLESDAYDINLADVSVGGKWKPFLYPHWYDNQYRGLKFHNSDGNKNNDFRDPRWPWRLNDGNGDGVADGNLPDVPDDFEYQDGNGPYDENWPLPSSNPDAIANRNKITGPNIGCPAPLMTFSSSKAVIDDYINNNTIAWNRGGTVGSEGLAWGWRMLDPSEPYPNPVPYNDPATVKALILMTDGENTVYQHNFNDYDDKDGDGRKIEDINGDGSRNANDRPRSDYTAYRRIEDQAMGTNNNAEAARRINMRMLKICNAMKAGGVSGRDRVEVYTVIFGTVATSSGAQGLRDIYAQCASRPANAFLAPTNAELQTAFRTIGNDLANLHLSR